MLYERKRRRRRSSAALSDGLLMLGCCVVLAFGLVALLAGLWQVGRHLDALRWQSVPAQVLSLGSDVDDRRKTTRVVAELAYGANGQRQVTDRLSFALARDRALDQWWSRIAAALGGPGRTVQVWVNPRNPADAVFERGIRWTEVGLLLLVGGLFSGAGGGFLRFLLGSRRRRKGRMHSGRGRSGAPRMTPCELIPMPIPTPGFSWHKVAATAIVGLVGALLGALLWRDGHAMWAVVALLPMLLAAVGLVNGLRRRRVGQIR